jgi:hypothetical protein
VNCWSLTSLHKTGSHLEGPCSSPDSYLKSGNERCAFRMLIVGYLESRAPLLDSWALLPYCNKSLKCGDWHWTLGCQFSHTGRFLLVLAMEAHYN